ncbi:hypothetical protein JCM11251_007771 [Rhodosporidiobolus azoricus]
MSGPFATPTIRASNPLEDALAAEEQATPRASPSAFTASSSPSLPPTSPRQGYSRRPNSPPLSPRTAAAKSRMPAPAVRARSPPVKRPQTGKTPSASSSPPPPSRPSPRLHPQSHSQQSQPAPSASELSSFATICHSLYYQKDPTAARQVDSILSKLPSSFRTPYAREMARVRAEFHRDEERRRRAVVEKVLEETVPAGTIKRALQISPEATSTPAMRSSAAKQLRREGLKAFLAAHCVPGLIGSHPFMRSLYAALYLQGLETSKGGAGGRCVEWEVDVAVFAEGGTGEGWARDAVEVVKGVLGMSDRPTEPSHTDSSSTRTTSHYASISRASSVGAADPPLGMPDLLIAITAPSLGNLNVDEHSVLPADAPPPLRSSVSSTNAEAQVNANTIKRPAPPVPPHRSGSTATSRTKSKSDPFLTREEKAASLSSLPSSAGAVESLPSPVLSAELEEEEEGTPSLPDPSPAPPPPPSPAAPPPLVPLPLKPAYRTLTLPPYLTDPECRSLCRLFPGFIAAPTMARGKGRFRRNSASRAGRGKDVAAEGGKEGGEGDGTRMGRAGAGAGGRVGHGELRIGRRERDEGWRGSLWERWVGWWRGLLGMV